MIKHFNRIFNLFFRTVNLFICLFFILFFLYHFQSIIHVGIDLNYSFFTVYLLWSILLPLATIYLLFKKKNISKILYSI